MVCSSLTHLFCCPLFLGRPSLVYSLSIPPPSIVSCHSHCPSLSYLNLNTAIVQELLPLSAYYCPVNLLRTFSFKIFKGSLQRIKCKCLDLCSKFSQIWPLCSVFTSCDPSTRTLHFSLCILTVDRWKVKYKRCFMFCNANYREEVLEINTNKCRFSF